MRYDIRACGAFVVANAQEIDDDKLAEVLRQVQPALARMLAAWPK